MLDVKWPSAERLEIVSMSQDFQGVNNSFEFANEKFSQTSTTISLIGDIEITTHS